MLLLILLMFGESAQGASGEERLPAVQDGQLRRLRALQGAHRSRQPQEGKRRRRCRQRRRRQCRHRVSVIFVVVVVSQLGKVLGIIMYTTYTCIHTPFPRFQHIHYVLFIYVNSFGLFV